MVLWNNVTIEKKKVSLFPLATIDIVIFFYFDVDMILFSDFNNNITQLNY